MNHHQYINNDNRYYDVCYMKCILDKAAETTTDMANQDVFKKECREQCDHLKGIDYRFNNPYDVSGGFDFVKNNGCSSGGGCNFGVGVNDKLGGNMTPW